jgi:hypothetical protein
MKRPLGVVIIGCLMFLQGVALTIMVGLLVATINSALTRQLPPGLVITLEGGSPLNWAGVGANAVVALLSLVGGVALFLVRPWAWTLALLVQGYSLAIDLWSTFHGHTPYLEMLIPIVIIFYLNTRTVSRFFEAARHQTSAQTHVSPDIPQVLQMSAGTIAAGRDAVVAASEPTQPAQRSTRRESADHS